MNAKTSSFNLPSQEFNPESYNLIKEAYDNKEIKITRSPTYRSKKAKEGHVFYKIKFNNSKQQIYNGAYEMNLQAETELIGKEKLIEFLLVKLTMQLLTS